MFIHFSVFMIGLYSISTEKATVLRIWKQKFEELYSNNEISPASEVFKNDLLNNPRNLVLPRSSYEINKPLTYKEVQEAIRHSKNKKACGIDNITNELLKCDESIEIMFLLFTKCFNSGLIPDCWQASIINPIPKPAGYTIDPL